MGFSLDGCTAVAASNRMTPRGSAIAPVLAQSAFDSARVSIAISSPSRRHPDHARGPTGRIARLFISSIWPERARINFARSNRLRASSGKVYGRIIRQEKPRAPIVSPVANGRECVNIASVRAQRGTRCHRPLTSRIDSRGQIIRLGSNSGVRTFTLRREPLSTDWLLESITDN